MRVRPEHAITVFTLRTAVHENNSPLTQPAGVKTLWLPVAFSDGRERPRTIHVPRVPLCEHRIKPHEMRIASNAKIMHDGYCFHASVWPTATPCDSRSRSYSVWR